MVDIPQMDEWARNHCVSRSEMQRQVEHIMSDVYKRLTTTDGAVEIVAQGETGPVARVRERDDSTESTDVPIEARLWGVMYVALLKRLNQVADSSAS